MSNSLFFIPTTYLIIYWIGCFFIVYHLIKYGITSWPKKIAGVFLAGSIVLSMISFMLFTQIDWQKIFGDQGFKQNIQNNLIK